VDPETAVFIRRRRHHLRPTDADIEAIPADRRHLYVLQERVAFTR
jgi:hypothetical protein